MGLSTALGSLCQGGREPVFLCPPAGPAFPESIVGYIVRPGTGRGAIDMARQEDIVRNADIYDHHGDAVIVLRGTVHG